MVEAHDPPGMVPIMKSTYDYYNVVFRPYFDVENPYRKSTFVKIGWRNHSLSREWYRDHFALVEVHNPPGMVPMMKSTHDG